MKAKESKPVKDTGGVKQEALKSLGRNLARARNQNPGYLKGGKK